MMLRTAGLAVINVCRNCGQMMSGFSSKRPSVEKKPSNSRFAGERFDSDAGHCTQRECDLSHRFI